MKEEDVERLLTAADQAIQVAGYATLQEGIAMSILFWSAYFNTCP